MVRNVDDLTANADVAEVAILHFSMAKGKLTARLEDLPATEYCVPWLCDQGRRMPTVVSPNALICLCGYVVGSFVHTRWHRKSGRYMFM